MKDYHFTMWPFQNKSPDQTLKFRVAKFWEWYSKNERRFFNTIEEKRCNDLQPEVSAAVDRWLPGLAWVFGPGAMKNEHSFTLSGEGILEKQFAAEYWLSCAPKINGWIFYASRQPSENCMGFKLDLDGGRAFEPKELWLFPYENDEAEKLDITVWHPLFSTISDNAKWTALFLLLDEVLGEYGTQNWINEITFADNLLKQSVPIWELREIVQRVESTRGWKKNKPTDTYTMYKLPETKEHLRGDTFVGTTRGWNLTRNYLENEGPVDHPYPDIGIDFVFVAFSSKILPKGGEVDFRSRIENDLLLVFQENKSGDHLGGATGTKYSYIDILAYDGKETINQVRQVLKNHSLPQDTTINYFTKEKAAQVFSL